jgi:OmpR-family two-component system manganese-sensing response regulator
LREESFAVDFAYTGEAADEMATVNTYDLIMLDWLLPDKNGIAVCRDLRGAASRPPS